MIKKITGAAPGGKTHPEIRPGDIWKDKHGKKITVRSVIPGRVYYDREGYPHICSFPRALFIQSFVRVSASKASLTGWQKENDLLMRIPMIPVSDSGDFDRASRAGYFLL